MIGFSIRGNVFFWLTAKNVNSLLDTVCYLDLLIGVLTRYGLSPVVLIGVMYPSGVSMLSILVLLRSMNFTSFGAVYYVS